MAQSKTSAAADFLASFFIGDTIAFRLLSDVVKHREDPLFVRALGLPEDFTLPFFQEEGTGVPTYLLRQGPGERYQALIAGAICQTRTVESGDYISFSNHRGEKVVKVLLIATAALEIGYRKYRLPRNTNLFIGRMPGNDIVYGLSDFVSREKHAAIRIDGQGTAYLEDLKRSVGIYVNGRLTHSRKLERLDEIYLMGLSMVYMGEYLAVRTLAADSTLAPADGFEAKAPVEVGRRRYFVSPPRILKSLDRDEIEIDAPPNPVMMDQTPAILTIGPSLTMSMVMLASLGVSISSALSGGNLATLITSATMAAGMLLGALMWPSLLRSYQKRRRIAEEQHRKARYTAYIAEMEEKLSAKADRAVRLLNDTLSPGPEALCALLDSQSNKLHLWERSYEDEDFLAVRLGIGERPFDVQIKIPRQGFQLYEDDLRQLPRVLLQKYGVLSNVPLTLDLCGNHTVGVIGSPDNVRTVLYEIILNVIALHPYDEVKLALVMPLGQSKAFEMFRAAPHMWSGDKRVCYFATNPEEVHFAFNAIDAVLRQREEGEQRTPRPVPHYVLVVTEPALLEKEALLRYIEDAENTVGLTTVFAYGDITRLPKACRTIIQSDGARTGFYTKNKNANRFIPFTLDNVRLDGVEAFVNAMARLPVRRDSRDLGIAERVSFLQMYQVGNVSQLEIETRWANNNSAKSLAAPIGIMAGGQVFALDIHEAYHGCHGLVAGTTGSGKSEFLQAFVLSLAVNYSPKEVAFVLIDFKGGDMARPFMAKPGVPALPHLAATISNLSGNVLYRALVSLDAEIKARQRRFNEAAAALGVDKLDINSYHKYYRSGRLHTPLPHLVIIIDEFAQLKTQQPGFLTQLIDVAQVGRSLGIHLILATQKPSGVVDPQIMSNSRFKVCLKVADKQDSVEVIHKPDAALIKNPGRLYLQVGYDEIYECVQAGYSGAGYAPARRYLPEEEITVQMTDHTANPIHSAKLDLAEETTDQTQLEAVVAELVALGERKHSAVKPLWLEMLPRKVPLESLERGEKGLCTAVIGLADYVRTQQQKPLYIDFVKTGSVALYGASGMGKTTFLQTLVYSMVCGYGYTPEELNLYAMDFGGRNLGYLQMLPHTGAVAFAEDETLLHEIISVLRQSIEERKRLFAAHRCASFADYCAAGGHTLPAILVLIDHFALFRDKYMDMADTLVEIIAQGKSFGVYFVLTGSTHNSIHYKVTEHIGAHYTLKLNDANHYLDILNVRPPITPEEISGRGITVRDRQVVEFQTAVAREGETEAQRLAAICADYACLATAWHGTRPVRLGETAGTFRDLEAAPSHTCNKAPEAIEADDGHLLLGTSRSGVLQYGLNLERDMKLCICGSVEQLEICYSSLLEHIAAGPDRQAVFLDGEEGRFEAVAGRVPACRYVRGSAELEQFIQELRPQLNRRLDHQQTVPALFLIIGEFDGFFRMITDEQAAFLRKVVQYMDTPEYRLYLITGFDVQREKNNDRLFLSLVVRAENYWLCPGSYEAAVSKIESLPAIMCPGADRAYFCQGEKCVEIGW